MYITIHIPEILYEKIKEGKADKKTLETIILYGEIKKGAENGNTEKNEGN